MPTIKEPRFTPLADLLRPKTLNDVVGQQHLIGPGKPLRRMAEGGKIVSSILWGPPGIGKTTTIRALAHDANANFVVMNATSTKVEEIRAAAKSAKIAQASGRHTLVFLDEIHRLNKAQQDVLLPFVEEGSFILFGATTEKPKFAVNGTILSRTSQFEVKPIEQSDLLILMKRVRKHYQLNGKNFTIDQNAARDLLIKCSGDARRLITAMEMIVEVLLGDDEVITLELSQSAMPDKHLVFDKSGNDHFDLAHCYQEAIQHNQADDAIYWLAKWIASGEDPAYIARRMVITAWEDCGGNPMAPLLADAALRAVETSGLPECMIPMAYATVEIATSKRNKAPYRAIQRAMDDVEQGVTVHIPEQLRAGTNGYTGSVINRTYISNWKRDAPAFEQREDE